jgi:hypothetical protein
MHKCLRLLKGATIQTPLARRCCWARKHLALESYESRHETPQGDMADSDEGTGCRSPGPRPKRKPGCVVEMGGRGRTLGAFRLQGVSGLVPNTADRGDAQTYSPTDRPAPPRLVASPVGLPGTRCNARPVPEGVPTSGRERPAIQALRVLLAASLETRLVPGQPRPAVHRAVWGRQLLCLPSGG